MNTIDNVLSFKLPPTEIPNGDPWENRVVVQRAQLDKEQVRANIFPRR